MASLYSAQSGHSGESIFRKSNLQLGSSVEKVKKKTKRQYVSGYTREKICNLNDHCNDDCNSSLELSDLTHERKFVTWMIIVMIAMRL